MNIRFLTQQGGPVLGYDADSGIEILEQDGLLFKNHSRSGTLEPFEDWRLPAKERAEDLERRLSNEQIFGLMLLISQTYLGPGSSSSAGLGTANAALSSMLNRQLESLIGNMKGTTIDIGVDTYNTESGNTRTDYSVKVTKTLFNERSVARMLMRGSSGSLPFQLTRLELLMSNVLTIGRMGSL